MHSSIVKLSTSILLFTYFYLIIYCYHLSCGWVVVVVRVYDKTVIKFGIIGYCKLSLGKMISNSAYGLVKYHLPSDNLQYSTLPYSITVPLTLEEGVAFSPCQLQNITLSSISG